MNIELYSSILNQAIGKKHALEDAKTKFTTLVEQHQRRSLAIEKAQVIIQNVAKDTQQALVFQINDVVNTALQTCFPDEYEFHVEFEIKRNKVESRLVFTKNGFEINPMDASGGGVVDVAAFALRIAAWSLGSTENTLIIDEGFRFLSRDLQPRAADILSEISKELNLQIVQVSHSPDIIEKSDRIFTVTLVKDISKVELKADQANWLRNSIQPT